MVTLPQIFARLVRGSGGFTVGWHTEHMPARGGGKYGNSGPFPIGCQMLTGVMRKNQVMVVAARRGLKANTTSMLGPPDCSTYERCPGTDVGVGGGRRFSDVWMFGNVARDD